MDSDKYGGRSRPQAAAKKETIRGLLEKHAQLDEHGGARCILLSSGQPCQYYQKKLLPGNFARHIISLHPKDAIERGFVERMKRNRDQSIPAEYMDIVKLDDFVVRCRAGKTYCNYSQVVFNSHKFERHLCISHPWEAKQRDLKKSKIDVNTESKLYQMVQKYVTCDESGVHCSIDPDSGCQFKRSAIISFIFKNHFIMYHQEEAELYGFLEEIFDGPKTTKVNKAEPVKSLRTQDFCRMVDDYVQKDRQEGYRCMFVPDCNYIRKDFRPMHFLTHFRLNHPALAKANGFFEKVKSQIQTELIDRVMECVEKDESGRYACRIDGVCPFVLRRFMSDKFLHHFRFMHRREANKKNFFEDLAQKPHPHYYTVKELTETDKKGTHCRIAGPFCKYVQSTFRAHNFRRHFRHVHPKEAKLKGFYNADVSAAIKRELKPTNRPNLRRLIEESITRNEQGILCTLSTEHCNYAQKSFNPRLLLQHFREDHPKEAKAKGFLLACRRKKKPDEIEPLRIKQEETNESVPIDQLVEENILRHETGVVCNIDPTMPCEYIRVGGFEVTNFVEHFRTIHPRQSLKKGFYGQFDSSKERPLRVLVMENTYKDEDGIHCRISGTECSKTQASYNWSNFVRHFRKDHPKEAEEKGFARRHKFVQRRNRAKVKRTPEKHQKLRQALMSNTKTRTTLDPRRRRKNGKKISFSKLAEDFIFRDDEGAHCRLSLGCPYVQTSLYISANFVRHFRNEHPKEAEAVGFFSGTTKKAPEPEPEQSDSSAAEPLEPTEPDETMESSAPEESQQEDTPHDDPAMYCRLCFVDNLPLSPVFSGVEGEDNPLVESIEECTSVHLTAEDGASICSECSQKLIEFQQFRQWSQRCDSVARQKKTRLAIASDSIADSPSSDADEFIVEMVKEEVCIEDLTEEPDCSPEATFDDVEDQKPFTELPDGSFACRLCKKTFGSLAITMEHLISDHNGAIHTSSAFSVGQSSISVEQPPPLLSFFKPADCDTLEEGSHAVIERRKEIKAEVGNGSTIQCSVPGCEQNFVDDQAYRRHFEICHNIIEPQDAGNMIT